MGRLYIIKYCDFCGGICGSARHGYIVKDPKTGVTTEEKYGHKECAEIEYDRMRKEHEEELKRKHKGNRR